MLFHVFNGFRRMTSVWQSALCFGRYDREVGFKPGDFVIGKLGGLPDNGSVPSMSLPRWCCVRPHFLTTRNPKTIFVGCKRRHDNVQKKRLTTGIGLNYTLGRPLLIKRNNERPTLSAWSLLFFISQRSFFNVNGRVFACLATVSTYTNVGVSINDKINFS